MNWNASRRAIPSWVVVVLNCLVCLSAQAQDRHQPGERTQGVARPQVWQKTNTPDGFTEWRKTIGSGCQYSDHDYTLDIPADSGAHD